SQRALDNAAERARSGGIPHTSTVPAAEALDWMTTRGAAMLGMGERIGSLAPGQQADIAVMSLGPLAMWPVHDAVAPVVRPGAGGTIAAAQVAKSAPDGYTLLVNSSGHTVNPWIYTTLSYDTANDLKGVTILARQPNVLVVSPERGWKTVGDLVNQVKAQP